MGRPLNKKYFGNRNIGSTGTGDNYGIGGEGLASISNATVGAIQINDTYKTFPSLLVAVPDLPTGVRATTTVTWEIATITVQSAGTGYTNSQTGASATLTGLSVQASVAPTVTINTNGTGNVSAISVTGGRGEWTTIDGTGIATWAIDGAGGTNAQATVTFRIKSIAIREQGSGYTGLPQLSWSQVNGGTMPSGQTPTLTTDSGSVGSSTNQENAITPYAYVTGNSLIADIIKQVSTTRYKVKTSEGTLICKLVTDGAANAVGEMTITATDSNGNTYYVSKLTGHKATLVRLVDDGSDGDWLYATGQAAPWSFAAASGNTVQIANA